MATAKHTEAIDHSNIQDQEHTQDHAQNVKELENKKTQQSIAMNVP